MRKIVLGLLVALLLAACSQQATPTPDPQPDLEAQATSWQALGGAVDFTVEKTPLGATMLLDRTEKPVVASLEDDKKGGRKFVLQRWTGTGWQNFATPLTLPASASANFDFQIDLSNRPVVLLGAGTKTQGNSGVEDGAVYRYENGSWKRLGATYDFGDLAIAPNSNIYLLVSNHVDDDLNDKSWIRRWNGSSWQVDYIFQKITRPYSTPIAHDGASLRFTKASKPVVGWWPTSDEWAYAATPPQYLEVWNGSGWTSKGSFWGDMILDKNDAIVEGAIDAQLSSYNGCGMSVLQNGTSLPDLKDATKSSSIALAVDSGNRPVVAHNIRCTSGTDGGVDAPESQQDLVVRRWSGSSWQTLGGTVDRLANRGVLVKTLLVDSKNTVYALFTQCADTACTNQNLYLSKYMP